MAEIKPERLQKLAVNYNVGIQTIVEFLRKKGVSIDNNPNTRVGVEHLPALDKEFGASSNNKFDSRKLQQTKHKPKTDEQSDKSKDVSANDSGDDAVLLVRDANTNSVDNRPSASPKIKIVGKLDLNPEDGKRVEDVHVGKQTVQELQQSSSEAKVTNKPVPNSEFAPEDRQPHGGKAGTDAKTDTEPKQVKQTIAQPTPMLDNEQYKPAVNPERGTTKEEIVESITVEKNPEAEIFKSEVQRLSGPVVVGRIDLPVDNKKAASIQREKEREKEKRNKRRRRKRITDQPAATGTAENKDQPQRPRQNPAGPQAAGDRSTRPERPAGDRPPRPAGERTHTDRPHSDRPHTDRPHSDRPQGDRPHSDRPQGDRPHNDRPQGDRPHNDRPHGDRPAGDRPVGDRGPRPPQSPGQNNRPAQRPGNDRRQPDRAAPVKRPVDRGTPDVEDVQKQVKETLARLTNKKKSTAAKHRRQKRDEIRQRHEKEMFDAAEFARTTIQVNEFMTVAEIAQLMDVAVTDVIKTCMDLGLFVSINQRLDAETITVVAETYDFIAEFQGVEDSEMIPTVEDREEDMLPRPPIVTVMGHVDHGKTSLLDYVRKANVIAGEAGGITQHIGAYSVELKSGQKITFLDTPGHEAFTAMRARGAKVTDVAIIVVSADDSVMPQTVEAINHAAAASVPIVFAINKIDKDGAKPERIKQQLADMNYLVEEWGGKYQSKDISAKFGLNVYELLELVLLEAEILDLKANPNKNAVGSIVESSLDRGRGYLTTVLVQSGTLKVGDIVLAGTYTGKVKAMFNERNQRIERVGPGEPALVLGLNGAPQAGDNFHVLNSEKEAKEIANKREQLRREMSLRTKKHVTLDEIGRRIAIGNFKELNIIVKGDVDGSIEALSDSLIKLSTQEIQVNVIHKAVGQISESDVMLATASDAIIVGFQVRPSLNARKLAEKEKIDIRFYSVIYDAIDEIKDAMQGLLSPEIKEEIVATLEVREVFKITKVGTIAGCIVRDGKITRNTRVRIIRDGIVVFTGELGSLKRFKDDVKEVAKGFECGLNIERFNDIKEGDLIEGFETKEVQKIL